MTFDQNYNAEQKVDTEQVSGNGKAAVALSSSLEIVVELNMENMDRLGLAIEFKRYK